MLDIYFCPRVVHRIQASPDAKVIESLLAYLHRRGHTRLTIQTYVRAAELFTHWLRRRRRPLASVDEASVRPFACQRRSRRRPRANTHAALRHLLRYLREQRLIQPSRSGMAQPPVEQIVADYDAHLRDASGLAEATRLYRRRYAREFIQHVFGKRTIQWERVQVGHIRSFIARYGHDGRVAAAQVAAGSLRSFFRWLQFRGDARPNLIAAVPRFPRWRLAILPVVMTDGQLRTFLATFDRSTASGRRDYAMAVCMADLGLRVGEVAGLTVDDVDECAGTLRLGAGKSRRTRVLPMPRRVRQAVIGYVRRDRAKTDDRHVFVRHRVPAGQAVTRMLIRGVMRRSYAKVAGCEEWTGTHVLRHTAATRLHQAGADLKRVADILGHLSIDTTAVYTKLNVGRLAEVALPWPVAEEVQS